MPTTVDRAAQRSAGAALALACDAAFVFECDAALALACDAAFGFECDAARAHRCDAALVPNKAPPTTPPPLKALATRWLRERRPAIEVRVARHAGSVPRETGTRMLVGSDEVAGTVGGGHLEMQAIAEARRMLGAAADPSPRERHYPLGPALGQCCGGTVRLAFAPLDAAGLAAWPDEPALFTLQLYGAGHVGRAIAKLLEGLPCRVQWIDERESEFPPVPAFTGSAGSAASTASTSLCDSHIERVCVEPVEAEVDVAPPGAYYLVLTHSHDLDLRITEAILKRGDFGYLGLIGSQTKRARFRHRFEQRGVEARTLDRMTCPIGMPGIHGKTPEVIAIAVVAQLLQCASTGSRVDAAASRAKSGP